MKRVLVGLLFLTVAANALAYYMPGQGRWPNRDPIGEAGGINLYVFAANRPLNTIDLLGLEIRIETHPVALGKNHSKITIIPEPGSRWTKDSRFKNKTSDNKACATLGAGPDGGYLVSNVNRPTDVSRSSNQYWAKINPPSGMTEDDFIQLLFATDEKYTDKLDYEVLPAHWTDGYNSNGYVSGLLNATGGSIQSQPLQTSGFGKPVPAKYFR